ncbi:MAG: GNAT family N-acetyltransferase [Alphaproteobacteria bacterium]|nr:GNAT family N-acetyltransferase [Alphaproteobacteria bacterium]
MTLNFRIIPFELNHLEAACVLHRVCLEECWSLVTLKETMADSTVTGFTAVPIVLSDPLIGFIVVRIIQEEAEILTLVVSPYSRRQGVGRALIKEAINVIYSKGAQYIYLEVAENNVAALKLYSLFEAEKYGERSGYYSSKQGYKEAAILLKIKKN